MRASVELRRDLDGLGGGAERGRRWRAGARGGASRARRRTRGGMRRGRGTRSARTGQNPRCLDGGWRWRRGPRAWGGNPRARAPCARARSPRAGEEVRKRGGWVVREDARGRAIQRGPEERADQRVDVGRDGRRTTTVLGGRARREGVEAARGDTREDESGRGTNLRHERGHPRPLGRHHGDADSANAPAHRRTARPNVDDDESSCCSATRIFFGERGGRSE